MAQCCELALFLAFLVFGSHIQTGDGEIIHECQELNHQKSLKIEQLMSDWYAIQIVDHGRPVEENTITTVLDTCPVIELTREDSTTIQLLWTETAGIIVYRLRQPRPNDPGYWVSTGSLNGSLVDKMTSKVFSGTVQIMKAVSSHMVLTFCSRTTGSVFSVLLSRSKKLGHTEIRSVHTMLPRRGLIEGYIREMCQNAAEASRKKNLAISSAVIALPLIIWFFSCRT